MSRPGCVPESVPPSAALLDAFAETSDDAMVSHDADGNVTTWNQTAERLFGYPAEETLGEPYGALFPDDVRDDVRSVIERVMSGDRIKHFETEILRKDGMPMPISMRCEMAVVGVIATALAALAALVALVFVVRSLPDLARYRRLRKM